MTEQYNSDLYPREVIIKAAYSFTSDYFVHLDYYDEYYLISLTPKNSEEDETDIKNKLDNAIISQLARFTVSSKTSKIRQLIMARAFSSSLIVNKEELPEYDTKYVASSEKILKDWFESYGE